VTRFRTSLALAAAALGLLGTPALQGVAEAAKSVVNCGDVITHNTTLGNDVGPCPKDGVIIGADNVTLNLAGHKIFGTTSPDDGVGVRIPNHTGVTIRKGIITQFDTGVYVNQGSNNTISDMKIRFNVGLTDRFTTEFGDGILIYESPNNMVVGNLIEHNGIWDGIGVGGPLSSGNRILRNTVNSNNDGNPRGGIAGFGQGINIGNGFPMTGSNNVVDGNTVMGHTLSGINVCFGLTPCAVRHAIVINNYVARNAVGFIGEGGYDSTGSGDNFVSHNTIVNNDTGIYAWNDFGSISYNTVLKNTSADIVTIEYGGSVDCINWIGNTYTTLADNTADYHGGTSCFDPALNNQVPPTAPAPGVATAATPNSVAAVSGVPSYRHMT